jgi:acetolactate synthase I/II/III large subunit
MFRIHELITKEDWISVRPLIEGSAKVHVKYIFHDGVLIYDGTKMSKVAILAGWGAYNSGLEEYATKHNIPVLLTWRAIDLLPEDSPVYCGRPGGVGQPVANWIIQNCETLLVLGARLDPDSIAYKPEGFAPQAHKIVVDIDEAELNKHLFHHVSVNSTVEEYLKTYDIFDSPDSSLWLKHCRELYLKYPVVREDHKEPKDYVDYYAFIDELSNLATPDDVIGYGSSGIGIQILMQSWKVKRGQRVCNSSTMGAMGSWVGAIGLAKASGKRVLCLVGDGGFSLNTAELEVIRRENLPIKIFVFENGGYGSIRATAKRFFEGRDISGGYKSPPIQVDDFGYHEGITTSAFCGRSWTQQRNQTIEYFLKDNKPLVVEVICSPDQTPDYRVTGAFTEMDHFPEELK